MKVLLINSVCGIGSTGKICAAIARQYEKEGHEVKIAYGRDASVPQECRRYAVRIGSDMDVKLHALRNRLLDDHGFASKRATEEFLRWAEEFDPDLVWLHNIHGYYINVQMLFDWLKRRPQMSKKWTLHDCWAFTGHCVHFAVARCDAWQTRCSHCPQKGTYPASILLDNSANNYIRKKNAFTGVENMTLIVPSQWLADLVKKSFLKEYPVQVRYNSIDTNVFQPTPGDFREKYGLTGKKIILGVAGVWTDRKGLGDFMELARRLDEDQVIVLVGLTPKQIRKLPDNIIGITRTNNGFELAQIYTAADVFVNPSREETFGMTTVEAISCGTHAIVYEGTACEEIVKQYGGVAVRPGVEELHRQIRSTLNPPGHSDG